MKLYRLYRNEAGCEIGEGYDEYFEGIIAAQSEQRARELMPVGDEGQEVWLNPEFSDCVEIKIEDLTEESVLCADFEAAKFSLFTFSRNNKPVT